MEKELARLTEEDFDRIYSIMEYSFPADERRGYDDQKTLFCDKNYRVYALKNEIGDLVAFITVLILQRDYGDAFFEIEKASGIQAVKYVLGRLTALLTVSFVLMFAMNLLLIHWYVFSRGGVADMSLADYMFDSFWRVLMLDFLIALPGILFYIAFTYLVGSLFQNGIAAAIASVGYALCHYVSFLILWSDLPAVLFDYLSPTPLKLRRYFRLFGTEWFEASVKNNGTTLGDALFCIIFLVSVTILFSAVSCMKVQKRSV